MDNEGRRQDLRALHLYNFDAPTLGTSDQLVESYVDMFVLNTFKPTVGSISHPSEHLVCAEQGAL